MDFGTLIRLEFSRIHPLTSSPIIFNEVIPNREPMGKFIGSYMLPKYQRERLSWLDIVSQVSLLMNLRQGGSWSQRDMRKFYNVTLGISIVIINFLIEIILFRIKYIIFSAQVFRHGLSWEIYNFYYFHIVCK